MCLEGPDWDSESCLALSCANGALIRPFPERAILHTELHGSIAMGLQSVSEILFVPAGLIEAQCALFAGVFLVSILHPVDAWRMFLQGLAIYQA